MSDSIYIKPFSKELERLVLSRGVPSSDLIASKFEVTDSFVKIVPELPGIKSSVVSANKQIKAFTSILEKPLKGAYTLGISSYPSDARAKHVALAVMKSAILKHQSLHNKQGKSLPLWYRVYGGFTDNLRDKPVHDTPCMLIITNINDDSSSIKLEKVRDLLEKFSNIPRLIVSGGQPSIQLFATKLMYPLKCGLYIGPPNRIITL
jgi:hypothetical protein